MPSFVCIGCCVSELHGHLCPHGLQLFYKNYIVYQIVYRFVWSELKVAITSPSFISPHLLVSEIESVDSLCRDDADMPMPPYIRKAYDRPNAAFVSLFR